MSRFRIILTVVLLLIMTPVYCQNGYDVSWPEKSVWPQSPTARSFSEVMMPSPSLMTGTCEFSVPVYTLEVEGVTIPLTLQYRSNGIRVDDDPQPIGYGWVLTPPLRVSRQINGRPDEMYPFRGTHISESHDADYPLDYGSVATDRQASIREYSDSCEYYDTEHDIYTIYLPGTTLTVIRNCDTGNLEGVGIGEYRIETDKRLTYIHVTDPSGVRYEFDTRGEYVNETINLTEWVLTKIVLPSGAEIVPTWDALIARGAGEGGFQAPGVLLFGGGEGPSGENCGPLFLVDRTDPTASEYAQPVHYMNTKYLAGLTFPGGKVEMTYETHNQRKRMLKAISVYWGTEYVRKVTLGHGCDSAGNATYLLETVTLDEVETYSFAYNGTQVTAVDGQDWWGYYNGKENNGILSPQVTFKKKGGELLFPQNSYTTGYGADRSVDTTLMRARILEAVTLPTGGIIEWEYEPHRFDYKPTPGPVTEYIVEPELTTGGGLRVKTITMRTGPDDSEGRTRRYVYGPGGNGKATVVGLPTLGTFVDVTRLVQGRYYEDNLNMIFDDDRQITVMRSSNYMNGLPGVVPLWYERVEEIDEEGKTVHYFAQKISVQPGDVIRDLFHITPINSRTTFSKGPQPVRTEVYRSLASGGYAKVSSSETLYETVQSNPAPPPRNVQVHREHIILGQVDSPDFGMYDYLMIESPQWQVSTPINPDRNTVPRPLFRKEVQWYRTSTYPVEMKTERVCGRRDTVFHDNGRMAVSETIHYKGGTSLPIQQIRSNGFESVSTTIQYATDKSDTVSLAMQSANMVGIPVDVTVTQGDATTGYVIGMEQWGPEGTKVFAPASITLRRDNVCWTAATYTYTPGGNLASYTDMAGIKTEWTWDQWGRYPLSQTTGTLTSSATWQGLVGVKTLTGTDGIIQTFNYDSIGRLSAVSVQGQLMRGYEYSIGQDGDNSVTETNYLSSTGGVKNVTRADGLGRVWGVFAQTGTNATGWIASLTEYDLMGRRSREWCVAPVSDSEATPSQIRSASQTFHDDNNPYGEIFYEASPRRLAERVMRAGEDWHTAAKASTIQIHTNDTGTWKCPKYRVGTAGVQQVGYYPAGTLTVRVGTDEEGVRTVSWTDFNGREVSRCVGEAVTSWVYDDYGDLRYVLPPGLAGTVSDNDIKMERFGYRYRYDSRGRMVMSKAPGSVAHTICYDPAGRVAATRDESAQEPEWDLHLYDANGRDVAVVTGTFSDSEITQWCSVVRKAALTAGETYSAWGGYAVTPEVTVKGTAVCAKYYDNYDMLTVRGLGSDFVGSTFIPIKRSGGADLPVDTISDSGGRIPGGVIDRPIFPGLIDPHITTDMGRLTGIYTGQGHEVYYYDNFGREVERCSDGFNVGRRTTTYNYDGSVSKVEHTYGGVLSLDDYTQTFTYDKSGRMTGETVHVKHNTAVIGPPVIITPLGVGDIEHNNGVSATVGRGYDAVGRISTITHGSGGTTTLEYDVHGWIKSQRTVHKSGQFDITLTHKYNGNVASRTWERGRYTYSYDGMNRLVSADYTDMTGGWDDFSTGYMYNGRGGMFFMNRWGIIDVMSSGFKECGTLDETYFEYDGNRITGIDVLTNATTFEGRRGIPRKTTELTLTYTDKGEIDRDDTRWIVQTEWRRGYPVRMYLGGGHRHDMVRDGLGNLVSMSYSVSPTPVVAGQIPDEVVQRGTRRYTGDGHVLRNDTVMVQRFGGGYFDENCRVHYYVTDYLGSNVAVLGEDGTLEQRTEYYPYGEPLEQPQVENRFLYGGKEYLDADGRNEYFYEARYLVPSLCIMTSPDPMRHKYPWLSQYIFCNANPINYTDPTGMDAYYVDSNGHISRFDKTTEFDIVVADDGKCARFDYGAIVQFDRNLCWGDSNGEPVIMDVFRVRGDKNAKDLFEFLADHIKKIEFSLIKAGEEGEKGLNFISTSHSKTSDGSQYQLIDNQLKYGYTIREIIHNHPSRKTHDPVNEVTGELTFVADNRIADWVLNVTGQAIKFSVYIKQEDPEKDPYTQYWEKSYYMNNPKYQNYIVYDKQQ